MKTSKKKVRENFRNKVLLRSQGQCEVVLCGAKAVDVHHIIPRKNMANGGYVPENGIAMCEICHKRAEGYLQGVPWNSYAPDKLFVMIKSSMAAALAADREVK